MKKKHIHRYMCNFLLGVDSKIVPTLLHSQAEQTSRAVSISTLEQSHCTQVKGHVSLENGDRRESRV